jgi:hypothetical protein
VIQQMGFRLKKSRSTPPNATRKKIAAVATPRPEQLVSSMKARVHADDTPATVVPGAALSRLVAGQGDFSVIMTDAEILLVTLEWGAHSSSAGAE